MPLVTKRKWFGTMEYLFSWKRLFVSYCEERDWNSHTHKNYKLLIGELILQFPNIQMRVIRRGERVDLVSLIRDNLTLGRLNVEMWLRLSRLLL